ncbi:hypothetical protein Tco_0781951 [Tanacetum coccineum]
MREDPYVEVALQAPPSPDYVPSPEEPEQAPPSLNFVPGPEHADDEIVVEDQPYAEDASSTAQSPDYVPESDLETDPKGDDDEDLEEDPVDYPADGGDVGYDEEGAEAASTSHSLPLSPPFILSPTRPDVPSLGIPPPLPISVPTSSPPLLLPFASRREDRPKVTLPPRKRLSIALGPGYEVGESSSAAVAILARGLRADYSFIATMDRRRAHAYTRHQMETEARLSREVWRQSMDASDLACGEVMSLRTTVLAQMSEIRELHDADRRRQAVISEMLKADHRRSAEMREWRTVDHTRQQHLIQTLIVMQSLQREVTPLLGQGQQRPVGGPAKPELPEEAGSSS